MNSGFLRKQAQQEPFVEKHWHRWVGQRESTYDGRAYLISFDLEIM